MFVGKAEFTVQCIQAITGVKSKAKKKNSISVAESIMMVPELGIPPHLQEERDNGEEH